MSNPALITEVKLNSGTQIEGDTKQVMLKDGAHLLRVQVDQRLDSPDYFSLTYQAMEQEKMLLVDALAPGMEVEIILGYESGVTLFKGEVSYIEPSFSNKKQEITIAGYDLTHRLTRGTNSRTFGDGHKATEKLSGVASAVVSKSVARKGETSDGLSVDSGGDTEKFEYVAQVDVNDFQFMKSLGMIASANINPASDDAKKFSFKPAESSGGAAVTICRENKEPTDASLSRRADFRLSTVQQVARVEVRGWDPAKKESILGVAEALTSGAIDGTPGHEASGKAHYGAASKGQTLSIVDVPVTSKAEAESIAKAIFDSRAMDFMTADVEIEGKPDVRAGNVAELKGFGTRYSGKYLVEAAHHVYVAGGTTPYVTRLHLVRNSAPDPA